MKIGYFLYNQFNDIIYKFELQNPDEFEFYHSQMLNADVKRTPTLHKDIMTDDDRKYCRGRVFIFKDVGPVIVVGDWYNNYKIKDKIIKLYELPNNTEILIHKHWNIENNVEFK